MSPTETAWKPSREEELAALIQQQKADDTPFQVPQSFIAFSYDSMPSGIDYPQEHRIHTKPCSLHGNLGMKIDTEGRVRCRICKNERAAEYRARFKDYINQKMRDTRPSRAKKEKACA